MFDTKALARLVERCRNGDQEAFAHVYLMLSKQIYYNAVNILGNENDAGDVLQEVMLRLYQILPKLQHFKSLQVYIYRTTYNCCIDLLRKRNPIPGGEDMELLLKERAESKTEFLPEEYFGDKERQKEILALINKMKPDLRTVLLMFYYDELSIKEIAQVLNLNQHTVKSRLARARQNLRQKLEIDEKSSVLHAVSLPVLTRIFRDHADLLFTPKVSQNAWQILSVEVGISATALGALSVAVNTGASGAGGAAATGVGSKAILAIVSTVVISAAVAIPVLIQDNNIPTGHFAEQSFFYANYSGLTAGDSIDTSTDKTSPTHVLLEPGSVHQENLDSTAGAPTSAVESRSDSTQRHSDTQIAQVMKIENELLAYAKGSQLNREMLLSDAGITLLNDSLHIEDIIIHGLEQIDTNTPNRYAVELSVPNNNQAGQIQFVLIIVINEEQK